MRTNQKFGWVPDLPDARDKLYRPATFDRGALPPAVDLRAQCPSVYDQGQLGSCTANGIAGALEFDQIKQGEQSATPSRLFIYYNERVIEGTTDSDSGAMIRDGIKTIVAQGAPPETEWPYDISQFTVKPPQNVYDDAVAHEALVYQRIDGFPDIDQLRFPLSQGFPVVFGFSVYQNFESPPFTNDWVLHVPSSDDGMLGGHAVLLVGYDHAATRVLVRNSWSDQWGIAGYFWMDYEYVTDPSLCDDFWVITKVK